MHLVPKYQVLTNRHAKEMFCCLQVMQQQFLTDSQMCVLKEISMLVVNGKDHKIDLQPLLMSIPDPTTTDEKLFHSVNNLPMEDGII